MKTALYKVTDNNWIKHSSSDYVDDGNVSLVLCFAAKSRLNQDHFYT